MGGGMTGTWYPLQAMGESVLQHTRIQHPIGQGFFHSATVQYGDAQYDYVYDCGARAAEPLGHEVQGLVRRLGDRKLKGLFISHMHDDHVLGLDKLLLCVNVGTVYLPYITVWRKVMIIAEALASGRASADHAMMVANPTRWLGERGVESVVYVEPGRSQGDLVLPSMEDWPNPDLVRDLAVKERLFRADDVDGALQSSYPSAATAHRMNHADPIFVTANNAMVWVLWTYVRQTDVEDVAIRRLIVDALGVPFEGLEDDVDGFTDELMIRLRSSYGRAQLKAAYRAASVNLNAASLSLFSGPALRVLDSPDIPQVFFWNNFRNVLQVFEGELAGG